MTLYKRIKARREELDMSQDDLARLLGYKSRSTIAKIESGENDITQSKIEAFAKALKVAPGYLMGWNEEKDCSVVSNYPYIDQPVAAGLPETIDAMDHFPTISVPNMLLGNHAGANGIVFMKVNGESMNKIIPHDSFIAVDTKLQLEDIKNGDIVVFVDEDDGYRYSVKRFLRSGHRLVFRPESDNPDYYDITYRDTDHVRIIGIAVAYIVDLE